MWCPLHLDSLKNHRVCPSQTCQDRSRRAGAATGDTLRWAVWWINRDTAHLALIRKVFIGVMEFGVVDGRPIVDWLLASKHIEWRQQHNFIAVSWQKKSLVRFRDKLWNLRRKIIGLSLTHNDWQRFLQKSAKAIIITSASQIAPFNEREIEINPVALFRCERLIFFKIINL